MGEEMKERPVIFNGEMVRAILAGRKTQTRRVMKVQPPEGWGPVNSFGVEDPNARTYTKAVVDRHGYMQAGPQVFGVADETWGAVSPFGQPGDRLWVKETFATGLCTKSTIAYRATHKPSDLDEGWDEQIKWTPSIHMSRSFSRIKLEITDVRVERLNDINEQDALAEGVDDGTSPAAIAVGWFEKPRKAFRRLWERIYGQESWNSNPWVWVVEFKHVQS
ncbi:hypothetical protein JHD42_19975 [Aeromonas veronii]|uniref:hypothetical protein n=1 Tax=Aeromonas veronii TaxID=654 RepID=UPI0018F15ECA|nr:hypothetical protein [Aeromonas veronii]MBJ7583330.1 hypothetical protein [Aeromonas veronii]